MIHLACGYDPREHIGFEVFMSSVRRRSSAAVNFSGCCFDNDDRGTNAFSLARFLVPHQQGFAGRAIFCDAVDQIMLADVAELDSLFDIRYAVQVVKHPAYKTRHPMKYLGTDMRCPNVDYPRKNWASVMLINCAHPAWLWATPEGLSKVRSARSVLDLRWLPDEAIGALPDEWNRLVDEGQPVEGAKILHHTAGSPMFEHYSNAPGADLWHLERKAMLHDQDQHV